MATRFEIEQRRIKIEKLLARGMNNSMIANLLGVSRPTVISDVKWIKAKNRQLVSDQDKNQVVGDALSKYEELQHLAMREFHSAEEGTATRGGYLTLIGKFIESSMKLRQSVGLIPKDGKLEEDDFDMTDGMDPEEMSVEELRKAAQQLTLDLAKEVNVSPDKLRELMDEMEGKMLPPPEDLK